MQRRRDERFDAGGTPPIRRRRRVSPHVSGATPAAWPLVVVGVLASAVSVGSGVVVREQSVAVALSWFMIAGVALAVPVRRTWRLSRTRREPDAATAGHVLSILTGLDEVEHRAIELGSTWPRLSVGPTGVLVIDVCPAAVPGPARRRDTRVLHGRLARTARTGRAARRALTDAGVDIPVQTLAVAALGRVDVGAEVGWADNGNEVRRVDAHAETGGRAGAEAGGRAGAETGGRAGAETGGRAGAETGDDVRLIEASELSAALTAGPALPMAVVDAAFTSLTHAEQLGAE